jgi:hypothetical protein
MVKIIERVKAHYESREMPFGKTYEWHPAYVVLECGCGKRWTIDAISTIPPANVAVILPTSSPEASRMEKLLFRRSSAAPGSMTQESVHNNTSVTRRLIQKAHPGVTTILRRPATRSKPKEKKSHATRTNRQRDGSRDTLEAGEDPRPT